MRDLSYTMLTLMLAGLLLVMAGWRWHAAAVVGPDRIAAPGQPSAVLLIQEWDCPDRRAAMARWLESVQATPAGSTLPVSLGVLEGEAGNLDTVLEALPRLDRESVSRVARAVQRSGISGTPALILFDEEGRVLLTDTFATTGPGTRLALAAKLLPSIHPPSMTTGTHASEGR